MLASPVKIQENIIDLIEQWFVSFVTLPSFFSEVCRNAIPPSLKFACHTGIRPSNYFILSLSFNWNYMGATKAYLF
jgi:hypothetical protein